MVSYGKVEFKTVNGMELGRGRGRNIITLGRAAIETIQGYSK